MKRRIFMGLTLSALAVSATRTQSKPVMTTCAYSVRADKPSLTYAYVEWEMNGATRSYGMYLDRRCSKEMAEKLMNDGLKRYGIKCKLPEVDNA